MSEKESDMPIIHKFWYHRGYGLGGHISKVGKHKRKVKGKIYESPKIILDSSFGSFIDHGYLAYHAEIEATLAEWHGHRKFKAMVLIFTDDSVILE